MQLKTAFLSFILLICPCALCYGQLSFLGVNGERGYSAMRGVYVWDLDSNWLLVPSYEFYRMSDNREVEKTGSTSRYGGRAAYDMSDNWRLYAQGFWQPSAVGYEAVSYYTGAVWRPFDLRGIIKDPFVQLQVGQARYHTWMDSRGIALPEVYKQVETNLYAEAGAEVGSWELKTAWHKVLQYSNRVRPGVSFSWADIPFMTAVVQGFLRDAWALRASYPARVITPYAAVARYQYAEANSPAVAVGAGLKITWEGTTFSGGVEVFEPRREDSRRTFFSVSAEVDF